jgi:hypothetical protein
LNYVGGNMNDFSTLRKGCLYIIAALLASSCATNKAHHGLNSENLSYTLSSLTDEPVWKNSKDSHEQNEQALILEEDLKILEDLDLETKVELERFHGDISESIDEIALDIDWLLLSQSSDNEALVKGELDHLYLIRPGTNIRSEGLKEVVTTAKLNEQVYLTGNKQSPDGSNYAFEEVTFADGMTGWVASHLLEPLEEPVGEQRKIRVNLTTNRLSFIVDGIVEAEWNVGSGKDTAENITPVGNYSVLFKDRCSVWLPKDKVKQGPCRSSNPLGDFQVWFHKGRTYGLHGTNEEKLLVSGTHAEQRRVSAGCVRNPNEQMAWLYRRIQVGDPIEIGYFGHDDKTVLSSVSSNLPSILDSTY